MSCHFIANWFFPQLFNKFWSMTVVVEVGQPDHQLDVLLQEALSKVEHAHAELFFGDLSITVRVKSPDVKKVSVRRRRWLGDCTWMQSSSPPLCQCCPPDSLLDWFSQKKFTCLCIIRMNSLRSIFPLWSTSTSAIIVFTWFAFILILNDGGGSFHLTFWSCQRNLPTTSWKQLFSKANKNWSKMPLTSVSVGFQPRALKSAGISFALRKPLPLWSRFFRYITPLWYALIKILGF